MRTKALVVSTLSLLAFCSASLAEAAEGAPPSYGLSSKPRPIFVGISAGVAYVAVKHPELVSSRFAAATLGIHAGYAITPRWSVGFELTTAEKSVTRDGPGIPFEPMGSYKPLAGCDKCEPAPPGGWLGTTEALFGTAGPRVEFSPFGQDGLYLGASAGLGFVYGIEGRLGGSGAGRIGYRVRIGDVLGLALEGGVQGQLYSDAQVVLPYTSLMLRPYF